MALNKETKCFSLWENDSAEHFHRQIASETAQLRNCSRGMKCLWVALSRRGAGVQEQELNRRWTEAEVLHRAAAKPRGLLQECSVSQGLSCSQSRLKPQLYYHPLFLLSQPCELPPPDWIADTFDYSAQVSLQSNEVFLPCDFQLPSLSATQTNPTDCTYL